MTAPPESLLDLLAQEALTRLAWDSICAAVRGESPPRDECILELLRLHPALREPCGAFVTIYVGDALRGCLGEIQPEDGLVWAVTRCAGRTPLADYRFEPIAIEELGLLRFKISVLGPMIALDSPEAIVIGRDGLLVRARGRSGLLLPDVPVEHGWDVETFLRQLWRKAGLAPEVQWNDVRVWRFTSQIVDSRLFPIIAENR